MLDRPDTTEAPPKEAPLNRDLSAVQPVPEAALLRHGIYRLPVVGPRGETILIAVDDLHRMTPSSPYVISSNEDPAEAVAWLDIELTRISHRPASPKLRLV